MADQGEIKGGINDPIGFLLEYAFRVYRTTGGDKTSKFAVYYRIKQAIDDGYGDLASRYIGRIFNYELKGYMINDHSPDNCIEVIRKARELRLFGLSSEFVNKLLEKARKKLSSAPEEERKQTLDKILAEAKPGAPAQTKKTPNGAAA